MYICCILVKTQLDVNNIWNECEWKVDIDGLPLNVNIDERITLVNEISTM